MDGGGGESVWQNTNRASQIWTATSDLLIWCPVAITPVNENSEVESTRTVGESVDRYCGDECSAVTMKKIYLKFYVTLTFLNRLIKWGTAFFVLISG